ncbi:glycoside hydrolase family 79 protein [Gelatoporia subvermispora B]|uniref:Glycoside hydrolase family 79 protein n=1 Tax=Ceriporiopsis subvermispora (strain B) TaxID=914234 RepID=M2R2F6_CERS8|nr:glycoside hydrolase family 79 protein [Gelatoporia subvermispora B]
MAHFATALVLWNVPLAWAINVTIPLFAPYGSYLMSPTLVSFSIEQDRWPDWAGVSARNEFTYNALQNYQALTGRPPNIRVGADSADHTIWSPDVQIISDEVFPAPDSVTPYPEATTLTVGDEYYALSQFLPSGTRMIWGVNLGSDNVTNAVNMAKAIVGAFNTPEVQNAGISLLRLEVGNEPDLYKNPTHMLRPKGWPVQDYVADWESVAGPVVEAVGISSNTGPVTLQGASFSGQGYTPREIFALGILGSQAGQTISTISQHRYSANFCNGGKLGLISFMSKTSVRGNISMFEADIAATQAQGLEYILGETNSVACHGAPGVSNTAGMALWVIDYTLQAATKGISEAYFHQGIGYKYNFIQPITLNFSTIDGSPLDPPELPHIQPIYYGGLVVNTFIGGTGTAEIIELTVDDDNVSGYAAYEGGLLVRAVFVNLRPWVQDSTGSRPSVHLDLQVMLGLGEDDSSELDVGLFLGQTASARRLVIQHADDVANLTWAGQSWENVDIAPTGELELETISLAAGVDLRATEAILIML